MSTDAILNQIEPNVILTAHATKVNRTEPNWTEPQTCLACQNHAFNKDIVDSLNVSELASDFAKRSDIRSLKEGAFYM